MNEGGPEKGEGGLVQMREKNNRVKKGTQIKGY